MNAQIRAKLDECWLAHDSVRERMEKEARGIMWQLDALLEPGQPVPVRWIAIRNSLTLMLSEYDRLLTAALSEVDETVTKAAEPETAPVTEPVKFELFDPVAVIRANNAEREVKE